jgi:hypothetical protein
MDVRGLAQELERLLVLAPVVEEDPVIDEVLEALGAEAGPLGFAEAALAQGAVGARALHHVAFLGVGFDHLVEGGLGALEVTLAHRLDPLLEGLDGLQRAALDRARGRLLGGHPKGSSCDLPATAAEALHDTNRPARAASGGLTGTPAGLAGRMAV